MAWGGGGILTSAHSTPSEVAVTVAALEKQIKKKSNKRK